VTAVSIPIRPPTTPLSAGATPFTPGLGGIVTTTDVDRLHDLAPGWVEQSFQLGRGPFEGSLHFGQTSRMQFATKDWRPGLLVRGSAPKDAAVLGFPLIDSPAARIRGVTMAASDFGYVTRGEELLVRSRPDKGLLGGMTEVPGSDWHAGQEDKAALQQAPELKGIARWHRKAGVVTHVFTHFPLELVIYTARVPARTRPPEGMRWVPIATLAGEALPNVMRKAIAHGLG